MRKRVANQESYGRSGRAYVLAGLSSHAQQRATTRLLRPLQVVVQPSAGSVGGGEATNSVADAGDAEAVDMEGQELDGIFRCRCTGRRGRDV